MSEIRSRHFITGYNAYDKLRLRDEERDALTRVCICMYGCSIPRINPLTTHLVRCMCNKKMCWLWRPFDAFLSVKIRDGFSLGHAGGNYPFRDPYDSNFQGHLVAGSISSSLDLRIEYSVLLTDQSRSYIDGKSSIISL